jgi:hypothetical protein
VDEVRYDQQPVVRASSVTRKTVTPNVVLFCTAWRSARDEVFERMDAATAARYSAWPAFLCYAVVIALRMSRGDERRHKLAKGVWIAGWLALVLHVCLAMSFVHGGSWTAAYDHTARRTFEAVGWNWGGGVWFNLLTVVVWGIDVMRLWFWPNVTSRLANWFQAACQIYLAFMMFNATVVFGSRPARLAGGLVCMLLSLICWHSWKSRAFHEKE